MENKETQTKGKSPLAYRIRNGLVSALAAGAVLATGNVYSQLPITTATEQTIQRIQVQREQERKQKDESESRLKEKNYNVNLQQARDLFNRVAIRGKIYGEEARDIKFAYDGCLGFTNYLPKEDSNLYRIVKNFSENNNASRIESGFKEQGVDIKYDRIFFGLTPTTAAGVAGTMGLLFALGIWLNAGSKAYAARKSKVSVKGGQR